MSNWGSTAAERQMILPGDDLHQVQPGIPPRRSRSMRHRMSSGSGWSRLGRTAPAFTRTPGSRTWLALTFTTPTRFHRSGSRWRSGDVEGCPAQLPGDVGKDAGFKVLISEPGHVLVLDVMGAFVLLPVDENTTRLLVRGEAAPANVMMRMVVEPVVFTMARPMLLGLKARAEGRPDAPIALAAIAQIGWVAAGITVAFLFLSQRRRWFWLALRSW